MKTPGPFEASAERRAAPPGSAPPRDPRAREMDHILTASASPASPLSVAFVCPGWPPEAHANGIIPYIADIAAKMREAGHRPTIMAERVSGEADGVYVRDVQSSLAAPSLATRSVDYLSYRISAELGNRRKSTRALIADGRRLVEGRGLQLLEIEEAFGRSWWIQRSLPIPVVVRLHGPWFLNGPLRGAADDAKFRRRVRQEGRAIREADAITAPSLDVLERTRAYYGLPLEGAVVIPPPTAMIPPEARWKPEGRDPDTIVFVGRFDRHKGGDLVIDAFAEVARRRPGARLRFIGPDAGFADDAGRPWKIEDYLRHRLGDGPASGRVEWLGPRPTTALLALRREGAVVVVGSRYETFALTVSEAMAAGCPVVAPRVGGIPEMVEDGINGLLFRPGDASDMAEKLCRILEDDALAARLGRRAGIDCEQRHGPAALARRFADNFRKVIEGGPRPGRKKATR